jgi:hypothetical protein
MTVKDGASALGLGTPPRHHFSTSRRFANDRTPPGHKPRRASDPARDDNDLPDGRAVTSRKPHMAHAQASEHSTISTFFEEVFGDFDVDIDD